MLSNGITFNAFKLFPSQYPPETNQEQILCKPLYLLGLPYI